MTNYVDVVYGRVYNQIIDARSIKSYNVLLDTTHKLLDSNVA